jgi:putative transcriptional regulator
MMVVLSTVADHFWLKSGVSVFLLIAFLLFSSQIYAVSKPIRGSFLLAAESMVDPRFQKAVILIIEHGPTGSVGLIINKPLPVTLNHAFSKLPDAIAGDQTLYFGGPVNPNVTWVLFQSADQPADAIEVLPEVFAANAARLFHDEDHKVKGDNIRILTGYAGWAPGQLDMELKRGGWKVQPARAVDIFDEEPESLWDYLSGKGGLLI